jgi:hypothetical protein
MLCAPTIVLPLSPCSTIVHVAGTLPTAIVRIFSKDKLIGEAQGSAGDSFINLKPSERLNPGDVITASQSTSTDKSDRSASETVPSGPSVASLSMLFCPEPLLACGTSIWVSGIEPGAVVSLTVGSDPALTVQAIDAHAEFLLRPGRKLLENDLLFAKQAACGMAGQSVRLPAPLAQLPSDARAAPKPALPLVACQSSILFEGILPGAEVVVMINSGPQARASFATSHGWFILPQRLTFGDKLVFWQEFKWCELTSNTGAADVEFAIPPSPMPVAPICRDDKIVEVAGAFAAAILQFSIDGGTTILCEGAAPRNGGPIGIASLSDATTLMVRQSVCDGSDGTWSDWSEPVPVDALGVQHEPRLEGPLTHFGSAMGVTGLQKGAWVSVISANRKGVIGRSRSNGDMRIDVPLFMPLEEGDIIHLQTRRCAALNDWPTAATVQSLGRVLPPELDLPVSDIGGSIFVNKVIPGAVVDIFRQGMGNNFIPIGSESAGSADQSVDVLPLNPADVITARQRMGPNVSSFSMTAKVPDLPVWKYIPNSTFRICQLTSDFDSTGRPHPQNTIPLGILGTDLGIPVEHRGRMYLFFGDCDPEDPGITVGGSDPIAYLTLRDSDVLQTTAPDIHWIGQPYFRRLIVDGLPPLGYFEVPTGGFSYDGKLYLFVARDRDHDGPMISSYLAVGDNPEIDFQLLAPISKTVGVFTAAEFPGGRWMLHICPVVVRNSDWPGLPSATGHGVLLFGSSVYRGYATAGVLNAIEQQSSNVYLAWAHLTPGTVLPQWAFPGANEWWFLTGFGPTPFDPNGPIWETFSSGHDPTPLLKADIDSTGSSVPRLLGEISVVYSTRLRRWILSGSDTAGFNMARKPWGPWTPTQILTDPNVPDRDAGNLQPGGHWNDTGFVYAPYQIDRWTQWDRSTRAGRLFYTLSIFDQINGNKLYQPQIMRSDIR